MLNLALVAVLTGSLVTGSPDGDKDKNKDGNRDDARPMLVVERDEPADVRAITSDTYAFGRPADAAPIKLWVEYAWGEAEGAWAPNGDDVEIEVGCVPTPPDGTIACTVGHVVSQRLAVGAQLNVINFPSFKFGVGGELNVGQNRFKIESGGPLITTDLESEFGLQNAKIFGTLRGRVLGIHGGYIIDLGAEQEFQSDPIPGTNPARYLPTTLPNSDNRDAIFFGGDFDYPSERFRLFGGIDYFMLQDADIPTGGGAVATVDGDDDIQPSIGFTAGLTLGFE